MASRNKMDQTYAAPCGCGLRLLQKTDFKEHEFIYEPTCREHAEGTEARKKFIEEGVEKCARYRLEAEQANA